MIQTYSMEETSKVLENTVDQVLLNKQFVED